MLRTKTIWCRQFDAEEFQWESLLLGAVDWVGLGEIAAGEERDGRGSPIEFIPFTEFCPQG